MWSRGRRRWYCLRRISGVLLAYDRVTKNVSDALVLGLFEGKSLNNFIYQLSGRKIQCRHILADIRSLTFHRQG